MTWSIGSNYPDLNKRTSFAPLENLVNFRKKSLAGLSLLELLVVVVIIGSLVSLSLPRFRSTFNNLRFDSFCQDLANRMRYLRERASLEQEIYRMEVDHENKIIRIEVAEGGTQDFKAVRGLLGRSISIPQGYEVTIEEPQIIFFPDATIEGSDIQVRDSQNKGTIFIKQATGIVELVRDEQ
jgi:type II secretory pathway pseudopilin PulG